MDLNPSIESGEPCGMLQAAAWAPYEAQREQTNISRYFRMLIA